MKGRDWKFEKYLPSRDDIDAQLNAAEAFFSLPELKLGQGERDAHCFDAGFIRGLAWGLVKGAEQSFVKCKARRISCTSEEEKEVELTLTAKYHGSGLNSYWLMIVDGGVTGYEGVEFRLDIIERTSRTGWCACAGTKGRWDKLVIPARGMEKVWKFFKGKVVIKEKE